ncbi:putative inactive purple acid phosphatase 16 [Camellia lanceoleosa]|uniref:Inactive purple acid phosphatase 16 n=1 Tax=Camellia lanceoleosa TaxID=1840588 RepID=A0ACC0FVF2_9ERIC|nr:putative inactive purple acid phosphatase 16 [Camellia lanceoleosa]
MSGEQHCSFRGTRRLELMRNEIAHNTLSYSRAGPKELWPSISNYVLQLSSSNDSKSPVAFTCFIDSVVVPIRLYQEVKRFQRKSHELNPDSRVNDVLPALPRQISWPVLNNLHSAVDLLPSFVRSVSLTNGSIEWKGACFFDNKARLEFTGSDRGLGGGVLHLKVDDKYQYSCDDKDNWVHGWICSNLHLLDSDDHTHDELHAIVALSSKISPRMLAQPPYLTHYAGNNLTIKLRDGEPWKKVFGPVLIYLNSVLVEEDALTLWEDAKEQMLIETQSWPYDFPLSEDFPHADQRGTVSGRLLVRDKGLVAAHELTKWIQRGWFDILLMVMYWKRNEYEWV